MTREIQITSRCKRLRFEAKEIADCLSALDSAPEFALGAGDLSIVFLDDQEIADLHGTFLSDATPTDVITFPGDSSFGEAGEICVGVEQAEKVHVDQGTTLSHEILLYLAHGWLHLCGYDDVSEEDRLEMRQGEKEAMSLLLAHRDPPEFSLAD